ncbi:MAG: hypothetical protein ACTHKH_04315 [Trinickia sp.]
MPMVSAADTSANLIPSMLQAAKRVVPDANVAPIIHHPLSLSSKHQSLRTKGGALCVVSILAYGVLWLWMERDSNSTARDVSAAQSATGSALRGPGQLVSALADATSARKAGTSQPATVRPNLVVARHFTDLLAAARVGLAAHDLSGARTALDAAFATHSDNADAQRLQGDLASLESRRDAVLRAARSCAKDAKWDCVRVAANDALAIDAGSAQAQALLQRAIVASGWVPLAGHEPQTAGGLHGAFAPQIAAQAHTPAGRLTKTPTPEPGVASRSGGIDGGAGDDSDPAVRAIVEFGWKHPLNNGGSVPTGANVAGH